jgi:hypothetical protein
LWADKAQGDFGYPRDWFHISSTESPSHRYGEIRRLRTVPRIALTEATIRGRRHDVDYILNLPGVVLTGGPIGTSPLDRSLRYAVATGNLDLVTEFLNRGARDLSGAIAAAEKNGTIRWHWH